MNRVCFPVLLFFLFPFLGTVGLSSDPNGNRGFSLNQPVQAVYHAPSVDESRDSFTPTNIPIARMEQELRGLLNTRLSDMGPAKYLLTIYRNEARQYCTIEIDRENDRLLFIGDKILCDQLVLLVNALDQPEPPPGRQRRFIPIPNSNGATIARVLEASRSTNTHSAPLGRHGPTTPPTFSPPHPSAGFSTPSLDPVQPRNGTPQQVQPPAGTPLPQNNEPRIEFRNHFGYPHQPGGGRQEAGGGRIQGPEPWGMSPYPQYNQQNNPAIRQVGHQFEGTLPSGAFEMGPTEQIGATDSGLSVVTDFRYNILDDLDVVIIDAPGADVARFEEMIREIERLSARAEPQIEVHYLKHVNCTSLQWIIFQVYNDIFTSKQGAVRSIPLVHPNAILAVGWGNAMTEMGKLIETLDKPVAAENSLLQVFPLKHASAQHVQTMIRTTFPVPPTQNSAFTPRIQLYADARTNSLIVQAGKNDIAQIERLIREVDVPTAGAKLQVKPFKLKNTMATDIVSVLTTAIAPGTGGTQSTTDRKLPSLELLVSDEKGRRMVESGIMADVKVSADARTNQVIVTAPDHCMHLIEELIKMLDAPSATAELKVFQLQYADANSMVPMLKSLIPTQVDGQVGPQLPGAQGEDTLVPVRFAVDPRTNCIMATGAPGDLQIIEALIYSLDREDQQTRQEAVYMLRSMQAKDVALAINAYLISRRKIQMDTPGVISAYQQIESEVIVVAESVSNSLIVCATPKYFEEIMNLIKEIDKSPPQVFVQVLIAEITLNNASEFGAEFGIQDSLLFNRSTFSNIQQATRTIKRPDGTVIEEPFILNGNANPGWLFNENPSNSVANGYNSNSANSVGNVGSQLLTNFATGRVSSEAGFGGVVFSANSDAVSIMIRALQETNRIEVLSRPQITAMNNSPAMVHVGQDVPRIQGTSTTNFGESMKVEDVKVGLQLLVIPCINPEGQIVMRVFARNSKIGSDSIIVGFSDGQPVRSPAIDTIQTQTMVCTADGETVVLGGLIVKDTQKLKRKVPLLGDIPILGKLFSYEYNKCKRSELMIILTPHIVRNEQEREKIKLMETARMNWCLGNVAAIHGDIGAYSSIAEKPYSGDAQVMFPEAVDIDSLTPLEEMSKPGTQLRLAPETLSRPDQKFPVPTMPKQQ